VGIYLSRISSPFNLPEPSDEWLREIELYDPDLRIFPSQKHPVYRLMRVARHSGLLTSKIFGKMDTLTNDLRIAIANGLVSVTTIPMGAIHAPAVLIVGQLRRRDLWANGGADAVADQLDKQDADRERAIDDGRRADLRDRARAMRIGYLRRTGARVSLLRGLADPGGGSEHPATTGTTEP
jgi:hypothetical protein